MTLSQWLRQIGERATSGPWQTARGSVLMGEQIATARNLWTSLAAVVEAAERVKPEHDRRFLPDYCRCAICERLRALAEAARGEGWTE